MVAKTAPLFIPFTEKTHPQAYQASWQLQQLQLVGICPVQNQIQYIYSKIHRQLIQPTTRKHGTFSTSYNTLITLKGITTLLKGCRYKQGLNKYKMEKQESDLPESTKEKPFTFYHITLFLKNSLFAPLAMDEVSYFLC